MRKPASWLALLLCLGPMAVSAVGLGDIKLRSALNEPLDATITLRALKPGDVDDMRVQLADRGQFARAGLDRPFALNKLRFAVKELTGGGGAILVTTKDPVTEPYLNFLVDLDWAQGRVIREYTVLLDPPIYGAAITSAVEQAVTTVEALPELGESEPEAVALEQTLSSQTSTSSTSSAGAMTDGSYGPVKSSDTLWSLAQAHRLGSSVTVQQMMMAMLRANPHAFGDNNINNLKAGSVLRIPDRAEARGQSASEALADVKIQHALWEEYRQSIGATISAAPETSTTTSSSNATSTTEEVATTDEVATSSSSQTSEDDDEARLEVVGAGSGDTAGGTSGDLEMLQQQLSLAQEQADIQRRENAELEEKREAADELINTLQRLVDVKDDEIAALQNSLSEIEAELEAVETGADTEVVVEAEVVEETVEPEVAQVDVVDESEEMEVAKPKPVKPQSLLEKAQAVVAGNMLLVGAGAGGIALLAVLGVLLTRRRRESQTEWVDVDVPEDFSALDDSDSPTEAPEEDDEDTEVPAAEAVDVAPDKDATEMPAAGSETVAPMRAMEEEDALEGLNIYLAYEDYDNATKLVKGVIEKHPGKHEYKLRLLEIFLAAKDANGFETAARGLQDAAGEDSPLMDDARRWWADLSPGRALFAGGVAALSGDAMAGAGDDDSIFDVTADVEGEGRDDAMEISLDDVEAGGDGGGVDFDLGFEFESADLGDGGVDQTQTVDFDLGDDTGTDSSSQAEAPEFDFDLGSDKAVAVTPALEVADDGGDVDLELDLSADTNDDTGGAGFSLDLDDQADVTAAQTPNDIDFALDLDAGEADVTEMPPLAVAGDDVDIAFDTDLTANLDDNTGDIDFALDLDAGEADVTGMPALDASSGDDFDVALDSETDRDEDTGGVDFSLDIDGEPTDMPVGDSADDTMALGVDIDMGDEPPAADSIAAEDGLDLDAEKAADIGLDGDNENAELDFDLELPDSGAPSPNFETVQLNADDLARVGAIDENDAATGEDGYGIAIDNDFADIFRDDAAGPELDADLPDSALADSSAVDFDLGDDEETGEAGEFQETRFMLRDIAAITSENEILEDEEDRTLALGCGRDGKINEMQTKLDLAQAYIDMGDTEGARGILGEVMAEGSDDQLTKARDLLNQLN